MVDQYQSLYESFRWLVPSHLNIGQECCHRWANSSADARRIALFFETQSSSREIWTYERLAATANQLANGLTRMGVRKGDRIALIMGTRPEALVAHIAIYSVGAVVLPLSPSSTTAVLEHRLRDAQARVAIFDHSAASLLLSKVSRYPSLKQLIGIDVQDDRVMHWRNLLLRQPNTFKAVNTRSSDPAILLYDPEHPPIASKPSVTDLHSTLGDHKHLSKGVMLSHAALLGNLPAFVASHNWFPHGTDVLWSTTDWTRPEGLLQALLPALYFGQSVLATGQPCSATRSMDLIQNYRVTSLCISAEALETLRRNSAETHPVSSRALRSIATTGKNLSSETLEWCKQTLQQTPNEKFGSFETGQVLGNSHQKWPLRLGSLGKPYPGHQFGLLDDSGAQVKPGDSGELCLHRLDQHQQVDPVLFLGYWNQETLSTEPHADDWFHSGIWARQDEDGYYWPADKVN